MIPQGIRSNLPPERLAWSLLRASQEFGGTWSDVTLAARLREAGESCDANGCWTTQQIVSVIFGNLHAQKLRKTREEADKVALANAITRGEYLNKFELEQLHAAIAAHIKTVVRGSRLTREEQDDVLRSMSDIKVRVAGIASRQRRGMNGEASGNGAGSKRIRRKPGRKPKQKEAEAKDGAGAAKI